MRLSEAIRLGSLAIPHTTCWKGCALGTAVFAMGKNWNYNTDITESPETWVHRLWPFLKGRADDPRCLTVQMEIRLLIEDLNGFTELKWTREQIAAWVETVEPQEDVCDQRRTSGSNLSQAACPPLK